MGDDEDGLEASQSWSNTGFARAGIDEEFLKSEVERHDGEAMECSYCREDRKDNFHRRNWRITSIPLLSQHLLPDIDRAWRVSSTRCSKRAATGIATASLVTYVIADAARIDEEVAQGHVRRVLEERHFDFDEAAAGGETKFDKESHYEESSVKDHELQAEWSHFQDSLKTESRFFNNVAESHARFRLRKPRRSPHA